MIARTAWSRPPGPADTADIHGIAPGLVITAAHDLLRAEAARHAQRAGAATSPDTT